MGKGSKVDQSYPALDELRLYCVLLLLKVTTGGALGEVRISWSPNASVSCATVL
jgi:hypothetical protein